MYGYMGKLLFADLTTRKMWEEELTEEMAKNFLGGYGIGAKVLFDRMKPGADPLGPDNILGIVTGPANATGALFGGRYTAVCKSPVTGGWNDANSGGYLAPELKKAGFDAIFVMGVSETPVYIWIQDGKYEIRDASVLWGLDAKETWEKLKEITGEKNVRAAVIGPGGENLSMFAAIINDGHRAAGRGGTGAVMGSKKLKAIACRGTMEVPVADKAKLIEINKNVAGLINNPPAGPMGGVIKGFGSVGTGFTNYSSALSGDSPIKNWAGGTADFGEEKAAALQVPSFDPKYKVKSYGCSNCPLRCGAEYKVDDGRWPLGSTDRPEYETFASFGSNCLNNDIEAILKCNDLCNRGGFDTISAGSVIAWVLECYEKGILTKDDLDGIEAKWGDGNAIVALMQKIYDDEGCGKKLKLGQVGAAQAFGKGQECLAVASGIEPGMHDSRMPGASGYIRGYQYDPTPGRHIKGHGKYDGLPRTAETGKADVGATAFTEAMNSLGLCMFMSFCAAPTTPAEMMSAIFGREYTQANLITDGMRILLLRHCFNVREGITRKDMYISPRLTGRPAITSGPNKDIVLDNEEMGNAFYAGLGCDVQTGKPYRQTLEAFGGMETIIAALYGE